MIADRCIYIKVERQRMHTELIIVHIISSA